MCVRGHDGALSYALSSAAAFVLPAAPRNSIQFSRYFVVRLGLFDVTRFSQVLENGDEL